MNKYGKTNKEISEMDFIPNPLKSRAPSAAASITLNVADTLALRVRGTAALLYYFNSDTTKTYPIDSDTDAVIVTADIKAKNVVLLNAEEGTVYVQGM